MTTFVTRDLAHFLHPKVFVDVVVVSCWQLLSCLTHRCIRITSHGAVSQERRTNLQLCTKFCGKTLGNRFSSPKTLCLSLTRVFITWHSTGWVNFANFTSLATNSPCWTNLSCYTLVTSPQHLSNSLSIKTRMSTWTRIEPDSDSLSTS